MRDTTWISMIAGQTYRHPDLRSGMVCDGDGQVVRSGQSEGQMRSGRESRLETSVCAFKGRVRRRRPENESQSLLRVHHRLLHLLFLVFGLLVSRDCSVPPTNDPSFKVKTRVTAEVGARLCAAKKITVTRTHGLEWHMDNKRQAVQTVDHVLFTPVSRNNRSHPLFSWCMQSS